MRSLVPAFVILLSLSLPALATAAGEEPELFQAVRKNDQGKVKALLAQGANINAREKNKYTVLLEAMNHADREMRKLLIESGADVNLAGSNGFTPLMFAGEDEVEIADLLLKNGANINARNNKGKTALILRSGGQAEGGCDFAMVKLLVERGADLSMRDAEGGTAFFYAAADGLRQCPKTAKFLYEKGAAADYDFNHLDYFGRSALFRAVSATDDFELIRLLVDKGSDLNARNRKQETVLHAAKYGNYAELLINKGADVNAVDNQGITPLIRWADQESTAKLLIEKGANVNAKDKSGRTALMKVSYGSVWGPGKERTVANVRIIRMLAAHGADVNAGNNKGETALLLAIPLSDPEIIEALLSVGADPNAVANDGLSALRILDAPPFLNREDPHYAEKVKLVRAAQEKNSARQKPDARKDKIREMLVKAGAR